MYYILPQNLCGVNTITQQGQCRFKPSMISVHRQEEKQRGNLTENNNEITLAETETIIAKLLAIALMWIKQHRNVLYST